MVKNLPANAGDAGDLGSVPGLGKSPAEGDGNALQDSCLKSSVGREAWQAAVLGVAKSQTWLSTHTYKCFSCTNMMSFNLHDSLRGGNNI